MEIRINKEIRNYTESMFFGLNARQFIFSLFAVGIAVAAFTFAGYHLGVIAGGLFGRVSYGPGGGLLHNGWLIWIFVFIGCVCGGCIAEAISHAKKKKNKSC